MRLIEKKNDSVGVTVDNGALINYAAVGGQNGALAGFNISIEAGIVKATKGRLIVQGYTFEITEASENIFDLMAYTVGDADKRTLYLVVEFDAISRNSSYRITVDKSSNYHEPKNIQAGESGEYYYPLATFIKNGSSIQNFESQVKSVYIGTGTASGGTTVPGTGGGIPNTPQPWIGVIDGHVVLGNASEFEKLANSYTVKFEFYRKLTNARYRISRNPKTFAHKTHWTSSNAMPTVGWSALTIPNGIQGGSIIYKKQIVQLTDVIYRFFKNENGQTYTPGSVWAIATRSKKVKRKTSTGAKKIAYKYNFVEFAYKAKFYNTNGSLIGESPLSNSIVIRVERQGKVNHYPASFEIKAN